MNTCQKAAALRAIRDTLRAMARRDDAGALAGMTTPAAEPAGAGVQELGPASGRFDVSSFDGVETFA